MRELLKETAEVLRRGQRDEMMDMAERIDAALSAPPSDSAMVLVQKIRETTWLPDSKYDPRPVVRSKLTDSEAAALIDDARAVPRGLLREIWYDGFTCGNNGVGHGLLESAHIFCERYGRTIKE